VARPKKQKEITINGDLADQIVEWQSFINETVGLNFVGLKLVPNEDESTYHIDHAIAEDTAGTQTQFTEQHRTLINGTKSNVTPLATGTNG